MGAKNDRVNIFPLFSILSYVPKGGNPLRKKAHRKGKERNIFLSGCMDSLISNETDRKRTKERMDTDDALLLALLVLYPFFLFDVN